MLALDAGVALATPVEIIHWGDAAESSLHLRNLIQLGAGSRATIIESYAGHGRYWTNAVALVDLAAGAALRHAKLQDEATDAIHFGQVRVNIAAAARYESFVLTLGGRLSRHDSFAHVRGRGGGVQVVRRLSGARRAGSDQRDLRRSCGAEMHHRRGLQGRRRRSRARRLPGQDHRPAARRRRPTRTSSTGTCCSSARADVDTKPELEILADDVKCSHGATVGDLDEAGAVLSARARHPGRRGAAHADRGLRREAIERVEDDTALREHLLAAVQRWLGRRIE